LAAIVAAVAFSLYAATVCHTVPFGDSGELITASESLGVAHPPGYPIYTLLGWSFLRLPLGEPALRMNLMSACFGALACGVVARLVYAWTQRAAAALAAGLALAASSTFWSAATVAEVYTLHLLFVSLLLWEADRVGRAPMDTTRARALLLAAGALGLGLAHHPTIALVVPAAALLAARVNLDAGGPGSSAGPQRWLPAVRPGWIAASIALAVAIPIAMDATLLLRARLGAASSWGDVSTWPALFSHVTAASYRHLDVGWAGLLRVAAWRRLGGELLVQFTPVILPVAALGLVGLSGSRLQLRLATRGALVLLLASSAVFGLRFVTEDVEVYFLPAFLALAIAGGLGVGVLLQHRQPGLRAAGWIAALLLPICPAVYHSHAHDLRGMTAAEDYASDILDSVPENGVLFVEGDDASGVLYLHEVLGKRRDVTIYNRNGILFRDLVDEIPLEPQPGELERAYRIRVEQTFLARELSRPNHRETLFLATPGYGVPPELRLEPFGLLYRVRRADDAAWDDGPLWAGYREGRILAQAQRLGATFALAVAASYPLARGEKLLSVGDHEDAVAAFEEAGRIASGSAGTQNYIGTVYAQIGDYSRAIDSFEHAVEIQPTLLLAWRNLALSHELLGQADEARAAWSRLLALDPGNEEALARLQGLGGRVR
jgi:Tfp pilus assembly protein PilF